MNRINMSTDVDNRPARSGLVNPQFKRTVQVVSWVVNLIFLVALIWAIYEAVVNGNPVPVWAWLGLVVLFAVAIGLAVAVVVYRGVVGRAGPFDLRPSNRVAGKLAREAKHVEAHGATSLRAEIKMMAGVLQLMSGATDVMDGAFTYDDADWKPPVVDYAVDAAGQVNLVVEQGATHRPAMRQGRCEWVIRLNQGLPTDLNVKFGAGKADLKLAGLTLARLRVENGVGELDLDLSGEWARSMEAFVKTGIGDTSLRLPHNVGIRVQSAMGFGSIQADGLTWDGEAYTNPLYGRAGVTLDITVEGGMGKINLA